MAVYIDRGHILEDAGKPWKHLDARCPVLLERVEQGYAAERVPNVDDKKPISQHVRRRCPVCFSEGSALKGIPAPGWLETARHLQGSATAVAWVYDLMYEPDRRSQVGMATDLHARLLKRFRATCKSRFGVDCIPWYYDLLKVDPEARVTLTATPYPSRKQALAAEQALRVSKRAEVWKVSSDV